MLLYLLKLFVILVLIAVALRAYGIELYPNLWGPLAIGAIITMMMPPTFEKKN